MRERHGEEATRDKLRFGPVDDCLRVIPAHSRQCDLVDIRSAEDNLAAAEFLMEVARSLTEDDSIRIVASLAGGRKTMGALLVSVMSLLGRFSDRIVHVLVNEPWDRVRSFYYPGCPGDHRDPDTGEKIGSRLAKVELVDVPFVPLRYVFQKEIRRSAGSYRRLIASLRTRTAGLESELEVELDIQSAFLAINGQELSLSAPEFLFYFAFCHRAHKEQPPLDALSDILTDMRAMWCRHRQVDAPAHWSCLVDPEKIDGKEDLRRYAYNLRTRLRERGFDQLQIDRLVPRRGRISVDVPPEFITINPS